MTLRSDIAFGDVLRRARQRREESLAAASRATRIAARYLEALEMGAPMDAFPGSVYARMFLRTYAKHLGLNDDLMLEAFDARYGPTGDLNADDLPRFAVVGQEARRPSLFARLWRSATAPVARLFRRGDSSKPASRSVSFVPDRTHRRRDGKGSPVVFVALIAVLVLAAGAVVFVRQHGTSRTAHSPVAAKARPPALQLPGGGRTLFPNYRMIAYYGVPGATRLGILGEGPEAAARDLLKQAAPYDSVGGRAVLPTFEIIAALATNSPQEDGMYRRRIPRDQIMPFVDEARRIKGYTVLDIQPGRADFLPEVQVYQDLLRQPDIGVALDPEWHVGPGEVPGLNSGSVDAASVNQVIQYLTGIVKRYNLPQKLLIVHEFRPNMISNRDQIKPTPQVPVVFNLDGFGLQSAKVQKYESLSGDASFHYGFKLFYRQDVGLMTPLVVLGLAPAPDFIVYQ